MFEISFPELIILAVVALLVLGPERLPRAAQFAGLWVRRARAHWHTVKSDFERELADEELRKSLDATRAALQDAQSSLRESMDEVDAVARSASASLEATSPETAARDASTEVTDDAAATSDPHDERRDG